MPGLRELAAVCRALGDETRLRILRLLLTRAETCVCELAEMLHLTQSNVSFHLTVLKNAGLITDRKIGKWMFYTINLPALEQHRARLHEVLNEERLGSARPVASIFALCSQEPAALLSRKQARQKAAEREARREASVESAGTREEVR